MIREGITPTKQSGDITKQTFEQRTVRGPTFKQMRQLFAPARSLAGSGMSS